MLASGRIGDPYKKRCTVPTNGKGAETVYADQQAMTRIGDKTIPYMEIVPCPKCCKKYVAPVFSASPKVFIEGQAAERIGDLAQGITGVFPLYKGSKTVFLAPDEPPTPPPPVEPAAGA